MSPSGSPSATAGHAASDQSSQVSLGRDLSQAWVGYQRRLDAELAAAGFADRGFPDGRVLRVCSRSGEITISQIGRELGITRQGAGKLVASLRDRHYVTVASSSSSGREKTVRLTPRAIEFLAARRRAARRTERRLRAELGPEAFESLDRLLRALGGGEQPRMRDYLRQSVHQGVFDADE